jgi:hypothetical protein
MVDVDAFMRDGFVHVPRAIEPSLAARIAQSVWRTLGVDPNDPSTWNSPVARTSPVGADVAEAVASKPLTAAINALAGVGRWKPRNDMGLFIARFPTGEESQDTGWHIDSSFHPLDLPWPQGWADWSVNVHSRGRALLLLALWTEIGEADAPTRIRVGSHIDTARTLAPAGETGMNGQQVPHEASASRPVVLATGNPGDVYLCHPFLVHAAQIGSGGRARLISQPGIEPTGPFTPGSDDPPVQRAIVAALAGQG